MKQADESINDANDRAIRRVCTHFKKCLEGSGAVVLLSNDKANREKADSEGIASYGMQRYIDCFLQSDYPELLDLVSSVAGSGTWNDTI